jgi:hypothetical protein
MVLDIDCAVCAEPLTPLKAEAGFQRIPEDTINLNHAAL